MQKKNLCKENKIECCMGNGKTFSEQIKECETCNNFNQNYHVVNRLEYEMYESSRNEEYEVKNKKGRGWAKYRYISGLLDYIKSFDEGYYKDLYERFKKGLGDDDPMPHNYQVETEFHKKPVFCKKNRFEKCKSESGEKSFSEQLMVCQSCASFGEHYRLVTPLEYAMFIASQEPDDMDFVENKSPKAVLWRKHKRMSSFLAFIKEEDEGFYLDMKEAYKRMQNLEEYS